MIQTDCYVATTLRNTTGVIEGRCAGHPYDLLPPKLKGLDFDLKFSDHCLMLYHSREMVGSFGFSPDPGDLKREALNHLQKYHPEIYLKKDTELEAL